MAPPAAPRVAPMALPIRPGLAIFQVRPLASHSVATGSGARAGAGEGAVAVEAAGSASEFSADGRAGDAGALATTGSGLTGTESWTAMSSADGAAGAAADSTAGA